MKKLLCLMLAILLVVGLCACGGETGSENGNENGSEGTASEKLNTAAADAEVSKLEATYSGLSVHHGQLHDHAKTGRRSDGNNTLEEWKEGMPSVGMEYVALLDHRQTDHMYLDEWDPTLFISGSEAMTYVLDRPEISNKFHYNMIFPSVTEMEAHLNQFPNEYRFVDGLFDYRYFNTDTFIEIMNSVLDKGGYFVIPHPMQTSEVGDSDDPLDYFFIEHIGYEVLYYPGTSHASTQENYTLWTSLLALDKRVYASAGCDDHRLPTNRALSTVYSEKAVDTSYIQQLRLGNYTAGPVGVRMIVGDTLMGGTGTFEGQRVVFSVGDFHADFQDASHTYRVDLISDTGVVFSQTVDPTTTTYFAVDADASAKFYRVEIHDEAQEYTLLALGNPIWNSAFYAD